MLLLATALGAALRLHGIGELPPGLYQDEAYNGLDAVAVLGGAHPVYFPANNGREPLYIYLAALSVAALGRTPAAVRLPAAFLGILTIPATYALGRALFGRRAGLLAAAICAVTFWPVALSRIGLRAGTLPLVAALSLACAVGGWKQRRPGLLALGGALYGLSFYTYLAARFTPLALSIFLIFWYIATQRSRPNERRGGRRGVPRLYAAAFGLPALAVVAPLALFAAGQPQVFLGRADQVSLLNPAVHSGDLWGTLFDNLLAALGMFFWRGDTISRHNLPGRPVFDPWMGAAFVAGVGLCLWRALRRPRDPASALALIWTAVMLAPTALADDAPHFLRAAGVLPMIFLFPALALKAIWEWRFSEVSETSEVYQGSPLGRVLVAAVLALSLGLTVRDYFGKYAADPNTGYLFQSAATELAREANRVAAAGWTGGVAVTPGAEIPGHVYVDRRLWDNFPSLRFLVPASERLRVIDAGQPVSFGEARPGETAAVFLWPYEDARPVVGNILPETVVTPLAGPLARGDLEPAPYSLYSEYRLRPLSPALLEGWSPWAGFEAGLALHGQAAVQGNQVVLVLAWLAEQAPGKDYQVFVHALAGGVPVAQADGPLGLGLYPSGWWRAGQVVEETRRLELPAGVRPGGVTLQVGLYDPATEVRLRRTDAPGDTFEMVLEEQPSP